MANSRDRILLVESDPVVSDLIGRQALQASGYQVLVVNEASAAITKALQWAPDLIITSIMLPGLSGKDLMVALTSQGVQTPVIILAQKGMEADIIQTFRLGAADYLMLPAREAEVVAAVGRVLQQVHDRRERERLSQQLQQTNQELQARVRELTTIFAVGKAVTSVTDQSVLFDKVLDGAIRVTQADLGWFLLREEGDAPFMLVAERHLPQSLGVRMNQPWDDGVSSLVAMSGEPLSIHGEPLKRFKIFTLGGSALIVPIKIQQKKVVGLLTMLRRQPSPFGTSEQHLLEALADYASISLVNARLFHTVEDRARRLQDMAESAQIGDKINIEILEGVKKELGAGIANTLSLLEKLARDPTARWRPDQRQALTGMQEQLLSIRQVVGAISPHQLHSPHKEKTLASLNEQVRQSIQRMQAYAQQNGLSVSSENVSELVVTCVENALMAQVMDGLLSLMIRFSQRGAMLTVRVEKDDERGHVTIRTSNLAANPKELEKMFDQVEKNAQTGARFAGLAIQPQLVKEILTIESGKIWLEGQPGKDSAIHFTLPLTR